MAAGDAYEAAGFIDAFQVEVLPDGADPMDIRYNMIHWTHRSTRGWSYGTSVVDPRTGEILKRYHGHDDGVVIIDDLYANEWMFVPHFYFNMYVFQYATSQTAGTATFDGLSIAWTLLHMGSPYPSCCGRMQLGLSLESTRPLR